MENGKKPAFVTKIHYKGQLTPMPGLTKREYFAAMAMQGYIATGKGSSASDWVRCADELLKVLESKSE
jgi:hypothetical protein